MFRVDDNFPDCKKVADLELKYPKLYPKCITLWLYGGCWSARTSQDGFISLHTIRKLEGSNSRATKIINAMLDVGLWDVVEGGYQYHDWSDWNELKVDKQKRLRDHSERQKKYRDSQRDGGSDASRDASSDTPVTTANTNTNTNPSTNPIKKKNIKKSKPVGSDYQEIFDLWKVVHKHPHSNMGEKRRIKIRDRLSEGYTKDALCGAVRGAKYDAFNMGENDTHTVYDALETILKSASTVDRHLEHWEKHRHEENEKNQQELLKKAYESCDNATRQHGRDSDEYKSALKALNTLRGIGLHASTQDCESEDAQRSLEVG